MDSIQCAGCGRDLSDEAVRYESDDGRILCDGCFYQAEEKTPGVRPQFLLLRASVVLLKLIGLGALFGSVLLLHSRDGQYSVPPVEALILGVFSFVVCFIMAELVRLGLAIEEKVARVSRIADQLSRSVRSRNEEVNSPHGVLEVEEGT
ncbi:MAG: hypothetical protein NTZ78_13885 [Candidatus Aureabacteria bacterium]|nr:hypothetical protein [Candidatus Auribacterota bacterium]